MKLAFYTYSYIDRSHLDIVPVLETVAAAGYAGVDISATWRADLDPALMPAEVRETYRETAARALIFVWARVERGRCTARGRERYSDCSLQVFFSPARRLAQASV